MRPRLLRGEGVCRVLLQNHTSTPQSAGLTVETPRGGLYVDAARKQINLAPRQRGMVDFYLQPIKQPFTGRVRTLPFEVRVTPTLGDTGPGMEGQVIATPQIPLWLSLLLVVLAVALCGLSVWALSALPFISRLLAG